MRHLPSEIPEPVHSEEVFRSCERYPPWRSGAQRLAGSFRTQRAQDVRAGSTTLHLDKNKKMV